MNIKELAKQAGFNVYEHIWIANEYHIERLAKLVAEQTHTSKQEPFGYFQLDLRMDAWVQNRDNNKGVPFYTAPPSKPWLSLTDDEIETIVDLHTSDDSGYDIFCDGRGVATAIEAALRSKNT